MSIARLLLFLCVLFLLPVPVCSAHDGGALKKEILILNSYHKGLKWTDDIMAGIRSVFPVNSSGYSVRVEYMDTKRISNSAYLKDLLAVYRAKYEHTEFDLILTSDDSAYRFLLQHGEELFGTTPAVFCGVNSFEPAELTNRSGITGVVEGYDIRKTIEMALRLHPGTRTIYYLNDKTLSGRSIHKEFEKTMAMFRGILEFRELEGQNLAELEEQVQFLPSDALLLMLIYFRDGEGTSYSYWEPIKQLSDKSSVPVYGVWDFHLGHGIVGGRLTRGFYQGKTAAEMGLRILSGESAKFIPVVTENTTQYAFDDLKLKQYNITLDQLPPDSEIVNYSGNTKKQLLVLNSYHKGMLWEDEIDVGLREVLHDHLSEVEISYDFMDVKRNSDPAFIQATHQTLIAKYANKRFDAILAVDDPAFHFLTHYHESVFPGIPVVFCGVNYFDDSLRSEHSQSWFTGIVESYDLGGTLDVALALQPAAERVIIINDTTLTGKANRLNIDNLIRDHRGQLQFELWEELSMPQVQARVQELGPETILLLLSFYRDGSNNIYSYSEAVRLISSVSPIPVYSVWDFYMGHGILGGMLTRGINQGQAAGSMILQIFEGTAVDELPLVTQSPNLYMFDRNVMDRYQISTGELPSGSTIINQPYSLRAFYRDNRGIVNAFLILFLFTAILMLLILLQSNTLRVRRKFEKELEEARNAAELANIAKGRFLANMSHEIRTPMNGLIGMTELAMETARDNTQKGYLEIVKRSAQSLLRVINDILDYSKIEAGKLELMSEPFDLHKLLQDIVLLFGTSAEQKNLALQLDTEPGVPRMVVGDSIRLRQVLCNLVGNGIKFTEIGVVSIHVTRVTAKGEELKIRFQVTDTGSGIATEVQGKLFHDFAQLGSLSMKQGVGTGLGLAISKQLVGLMQGNITFESTPGEGSTFSFEIPLLRSPVAVERREKEERIKPIHPGRQAHVLVAEDDEISQSLIRLVLEKQGYTVTAVYTGTEAIFELEQETFDLVILDINMPGMSGLEVASAIRSQEPSGQRIPIVAMSANAMLGDKEKGYAAGMDDYLTKPIEVDEVYRTVSRLLEDSTAAVNG